MHCKKLMKMLHVVVFKCTFCVLSEFGNAWANENIFSVTEGIIWFRYHNYLASKLYKEHPSWSDEELFQNARKRVIATLQVKQIVINYWLTSCNSTAANLEGCTAVSFTSHFLWTLGYEYRDIGLDFRIYGVCVLSFFRISHSMSGFRPIWENKCLPIQVSCVCVWMCTCSGNLWFVSVSDDRPTESHTTI